MVFVLVWWWVSARKWFRGPKYVVVCSIFLTLRLTDYDRVNIEHQMLGRSEAAIEGVGIEGELSSSSSTKDGKGAGMDNWVGWMR